MIFQPPVASYKDGDGVFKIAMPDGVRISAVYLPNPDARFTLLCSHGNAEDIGQMRDVLELMRKHGFAVFAYDYRGYGTSGGTPSEDRCYQDADAIYQHLVAQLHVPPDRIIIYGRSLGGAMATYIASRHPAAGLILESSFVTAFRVVTRVPFGPFDKYRNIDRIGRIRCPVLVIHGRQDEVVPFSHGMELFEAANRPKLSLWVDAAHHNDLVWTAGQAYWDKLAEMRQVVQSQPPPTADH
jgi:fermentation-respiration switch protein FrsA (DUF1100 family)